MRKELQTKHHNNVLIEDFEGIRRLNFGHGACREQGAINLSDLRHHVYDYSLMAMYSLQFCPSPSRILVVGLGAGVIPREMSFLNNDVFIDAVEIDKDIVDIARTFFYYEDDTTNNPKIKTVVEDAWRFINDSDKFYDIVVIDAFMENYIPYHLMSMEFFEAVKLRLSDKGVIAANIANVHPSYSSQIKTFMSVFGDNIYEVRGINNKCQSMIFFGNDFELSKDLILPNDRYENAKIKPLIPSTEIENASPFRLGLV